MIRRRTPLSRKKKEGSDRFGVQKFEAYGESFRSKLEFAVRNMLKMREMAGEIKILQRECHVKMHEAGFLYIPDFRCLDLKTNEEFYVEAKGFETDIWKRNRRLWEFHGLGKLEVWVGSAAYPKLKETIIPRSDCCKNCGRPFTEAK